MVDYFPVTEKARVRFSLDPQDFLLDSQKAVLMNQKTHPELRIVIERSAKTLPELRAVKEQGNQSRTLGDTEYRIIYPRTKKI